MIIVSLDTTGLPKKMADWDPAVIGLGIAVTDAEKILLVDGCYISQPPQHLYHDMATRAYKASRIKPELVEKYGMQEVAVSNILQSTLQGQFPYCWNWKFHGHFLKRPPWYIQALGGDLGELCVKTILGGGEQGGLFGAEEPPKPKKVNQNRALGWLADSGYDLREDLHINGVKIDVGVPPMTIPTVRKVARLAEIAVRCGVGGLQ